MGCTWRWWNLYLAIKQCYNPEIENFISSQYGNDTQGLLSDFVKFVKLSLDDGYPAISKDEARRRVWWRYEWVFKVIVDDYS